MANYCPTVDGHHGHDQQWCEDQLSKYYVGMLFAVVEHYFVDGAVHICQTFGVCDAKSSGYLPLRQSHPDVRRYTCEECVQGLEWVQRDLEDPVMIAEFVVYLEQVCAF